MDKIETAKYLLERIGMPPQQQSTLCCLTLLAMANIKKEGKFEDATNEWIRIHDVIDFVDKEYGMKAVIYARVSSAGERQNNDRQVGDLTDYANYKRYDIVKVYEEKVTGAKKNQERPVLLTYSHP